MGCGENDVEIKMLDEKETAVSVYARNVINNFNFPFSSYDMLFSKRRNGVEYFDAYFELELKDCINAVYTIRENSIDVADYFFRESFVIFLEYGYDKGIY